MKKLIIVVLLCVCSAAFSQEPDWDLRASSNSDGSVTLFNWGDDDITIMSLEFRTWEVLPQPVFNDNMLGYMRVYRDSGTDVLFGCILGNPIVLAPHQEFNVGPIVAPEFSYMDWGQEFEADDYANYIFEWIPEPASMSMLVLGALALVRRRK